MSYNLCRLKCKYNYNPNDRGIQSLNNWCKTNNDINSKCFKYWCECGPNFDISLCNNNYLPSNNSKSNNLNRNIVNSLILFLISNFNFIILILLFLLY